MQTACPLCGATDARVIYSVTAAQCAQNWVPKRSDPARHSELAAHIAVLWGRGSASANECATCAFGFANPFVAGDARFYELAFGPSNYPRDKWEFRKTLQTLREINPTGKALEVGSGYGYFLEQVSPRYFEPANVTAIEYNDVAIDRLNELGFNTTSRDLPALAEQGVRYAAVFMYQILEHRDAIHETFDALERLLDADGSIFIAVPNPPSVRFWEATGAMLDAPPNHIGFWQPNNLKAAAERHGLKVREMALEPFSIWTFMKWDTFFSYTMRAQRGSFPAASLYANRRKGFGRFANLIALLAYAPLRVPTWLKAYRRKDELSPHIWVHLGRA